MFWLILAILVWGVVHSLTASLGFKELPPPYVRRRFHAGTTVCCTTSSPWSASPPSCT
ncbi:MAG: hypothetical protein MZV64_17930 [Ignavibacteriales bacterium]|nr:hypothetical protein [Ignavibacteriales bacterium]